MDKEESIRAAMDAAWRDHQHTRDQTWKALQIEFALTTGIVGASWLVNSVVLMSVAILFVLVVAYCGVQITLHHRNDVEIRTFGHIENCEKALGLYRDDLIGGTTLPDPITPDDAFNPSKRNTAVFILRMHLSIMFFAVFLLIWRLATR